VVPGCVPKPPPGAERWDSQYESDND